MKKLFGTDGMRGLAGEFPLDEATISKVGSSLAAQFNEKSGKKVRFVIGRDTRESGEWIEKAFCAGAKAIGAECASAGVMTTPGVAFLTSKLDFDAGIVISASHNPYEDNGIKIFSPSGKKIGEATEKIIEKDIFNKDIFNKDIFNGQLVVINRESVCDNSHIAEFQNSYLQYLSGGFKNLSLENFKMVIDCANGAASRLAPRLFENFGAEVVSINFQPDGKNINKDCGSLHLEHLQKKVSEEKADFGVAFDGDADRALFVDEKGNLVDGDATLWIMANYLESHGKLNNHKVVATVMSNIGLEIALKSKNIELLRTAVGDKYVLEKLLETGARVGGEQSGHIIFPEKSLVGDGMMTTLFLLQAIREKSITFSEMTQGFTQFPQILVNVKVREKLPFEEIPAIAEAAKRIENELGGKGRLLLRYSGTENLARVMIEGENQTEIEAQAHRLAEIIRQNLC
ncbi:MAG: phosphoglucosamine mutase [Pyrinomonadaceae bacterium]|nr:phosphoglucosamine mutase [Pyrinomonadaceae bacterium]